MCRPPVLEHFFPNQLARGVVECLIAALTAIAVIVLARRRAPDLLKEVPTAQLRGLLQIVAVGAILAALLHGPQWTSIFVLALIAIGVGAGSILAIMIATGVIPLRILVLVPVGSMVIANTMNTQSLF